MKNILNLAILFLIVGCSAQTPIINIKDDYGSSISDAYYKDINNLLNSYQGTWLYNNTATNSSLKIILVKKTMEYNGKYYEDLIIGEYEYKVNGVVIISTLADLNTAYQHQRRHKLWGNTMLKRSSRPICNDCGLDERRLSLTFSDPTTVTYGTMLVRKILQGGQNAVKIFIRSTGPGTYAPGTLPPTPFKVPAGEYILIKQ